MASEVRIGLDLQVSRGSVRKPRLKAIDPHVPAQVFDYALTTAQVNLAHLIETGRVIPEQRRQLRELVAQMRPAGSGHARRVACDTAIHTVIAEASGNPLNSILLAALRPPEKASSRIHVGVGGVRHVLPLRHLDPARCAARRRCRRTRRHHNSIDLPGPAGLECLHPFVTTREEACAH